MCCCCCKAASRGAFATQDIRWLTNWPCCLLLFVCPASTSHNMAPQLVWNSASSPHPVQAIGRIYRMGQQHPTFVYRLLYSGTAEHVMHNQSVDKQGLFMRVVDEKYIRGDSCGVLSSCRQLSMPAGHGCQPDQSCLQSSACPWLCLHFHMC